MSKAEQQHEYKSAKNGGSGHRAVLGFR